MSKLPTKSKTTVRWVIIAGLLAAFTGCIDQDQSVSYPLGPPPSIPAERIEYHVAENGSIVVEMDAAAYLELRTAADKANQWMRQCNAVIDEAGVDRGSANGSGSGGL